VQLVESIADLYYSRDDAPLVAAIVLLSAIPHLHEKAHLVGWASSFYRLPLSCRDYSCLLLQTRNNEIGHFYEHIGLLSGKRLIPLCFTGIDKSLKLINCIFP
jgi:hypothetical protein